MPTTDNYLYYSDLDSIAHKWQKIKTWSSYVSWQKGQTPFTTDEWRLLQDALVCIEWRVNHTTVTAYQYHYTFQTLSESFSFPSMGGEQTNYIYNLYGHFLCEVTGSQVIYVTSNIGLEKTSPGPSYPKVYDEDTGSAAWSPIAKTYTLTTNNWAEEDLRCPLWAYPTAIYLLDTLL